MIYLFSVLLDRAHAPRVEAVLMRVEVHVSPVQMEKLVRQEILLIVRSYISLYIDFYIHFFSHLNLYISDIPVMIQDTTLEAANKDLKLDIPQYTLCYGTCSLGHSCGQPILLASFIICILYVI